MAHRRKAAYIARFVVLCWLAIAALIGIIVGLTYLLKSTLATIIVVQVIIYSALFGFLGAQRYRWKRDGWPSDKRSDRRWGRADKNGANESEEDEHLGSGWK